MQIGLQKMSGSRKSLISMRLGVQNSVELKPDRDNAAKKD
jgi:hypothetical protein